MDQPQDQFEKTPFEADFAEKPPRPPRGCFFYGCLIAGIVSALGLLMIGALLFTGYYYLNQIVKEWTSTTPVPIPKVVMSEDQRKSLDERVAAFKKALDKGEAAELVLTADEINALIDEQEGIKGKLYVTIKDDKVSGQLSLPLGELGLPLPGLKGRYFNGSATLTVSLRDGELVVHAQEMEANGKSLPPNVKTSLSNENLAKDFNKDPDTAKMMRKFESIEIKDSKVFIKARAKTEAEKAEAEETKATEEPSKEKDKPAVPEKAKEANPPAEKKPAAEPEAPLPKKAA